MTHDEFYALSYAERATVWQRFTPAEKDRLRDRGALHPKLVGLEGKRVTVAPPRPYGKSRFIVSMSSGWQPVHLAMRKNAHGSSDTISHTESFDVVKVERP